MPLYTFALRNSCSTVSDETGIHAPDREHAVAYGKDVVRELMHGRELHTRYWRLDVYEDGRECVAEIPFAAVDPTSDDLWPEYRKVIERLYGGLRTWQDAFQTAQDTVRESRARLAQARGKPYLGIVGGRRTTR